MLLSKSQEKFDKVSPLTAPGLDKISGWCHIQNNQLCIKIGQFKAEIGLFFGQLGKLLGIIAHW
jgi:hypothetical protein